MTFYALGTIRDSHRAQQDSGFSSLCSSVGCASATHWVTSLTPMPMPMQLGNFISY
jgi:hypothetical protein